MKFKASIFLVLFFTPFLVSAQSPLILSGSNETALQAGVYLSRVVNIAKLVPPVVGANKVWDYSKLQGGSINTTSLIPASTFSGTAVADTSSSETVADNLSIPITAVYDMDASGFFGAGAIIARQSYSLTSQTGGKNDSLVVPAQVYKYRASHLSFPASYDSVWHSNPVHTVNFVVTAKAYFLNKTPASKVSHATITDSVVGWGTLSIPSFNKGSIPYPVLLVKEETKTIDSFFLDKSPAPALLLNQFNVTQGQTSYDYSEYFYRAGTLESMLTIGYDTDYTYTNPSTANFTADNVQSGIENENTSVQNLSIYPNPSTSGIVQCSFTKLSSVNWQLNVINSLGQAIRTQTISGSGNLKEEIDLNSIYSSGLYFVNVVDENGSLIASSKLNLAR